ncbi:hypothetical protein LTR28_001787, partial [Elasticomyces elasticus]
MSSHPIGPDPLFGPHNRKQGKGARPDMRNIRADGNSKNKKVEGGERKRIPHCRSRQQTATAAPKIELSGAISSATDPPTAPDSA